MALNIQKGTKTKPQKVCIYGVEGVGKSTLASQFPAPLFLDLEDGTARLDVERVEPAHGWNWDTLLQTIEEIAFAPGICKTLVIDTGDKAEALATSHICDKNKKTSIEDFGYGKGYKVLSETVQDLFNKLDLCIKNGKHVVILAHAQIRKFEQPDEAGAYDKWELKLTKHVAPLVKEWADLLLFCNFTTHIITTQDKKKKASTGKRVIYTTHNACWDAKNRWGLPEQLDMEYANISQCFGTDVVSTKEQYVKTFEAVEVDSPVEPEKVEVTVESKTVQSPLEDLRNLMFQSLVSELEIEEALALAGLYEKGTKLEELDPLFIKNELVAKWDSFVNFINNKVRSIQDEDLAF